MGRIGHFVIAQAHLGVERMCLEQKVTASDEILVKQIGLICARRAGQISGQKVSFLHRRHQGRLPAAPEGTSPPQ